MTGLPATCRQCGGVIEYRPSTAMDTGDGEGYWAHVNPTDHNPVPPAPMDMSYADMDPPGPIVPRLHSVLSPAEALEALAALEHEQWVAWAKNVAETESLTAGRKLRWEKLFVPYCDLSEEMKERDRVWARRALGILTGVRV